MKEKMGFTGVGQDVWIAASHPDRIGLRRPETNPPPPNYPYSSLLVPFVFLHVIASLAPNSVHITAINRQITTP